MFSEKNIPKLIVITPIVAILFITVFSIYFFTITQNEYFIEESNRLEVEFNKEQKDLIKNQVDTVISYITHQEQIYNNNAIEQVIKRTYILSTRLNQLYSDLNLKVNNKKQQDILKNLINSKLSEDNYFFAYDVNSNKIIQPSNKDIVQEFKDDDKFFENYLFSEEGKLISFEKTYKIIYIKYLPKLNWIIGNIENIQKDINFIKEASLSYISDIRFNKNKRIWIYDENHYLLTKKEKEIIELSTKNNNDVINSFVNLAVDNDEGSFTNYKWNKSSKDKFLNKIGYVKHFEKWNWVIGTDLYVDDIQKSISEKKRLLEERITKYIESVITISLIVMSVIAILSMIMSNEISDTFKKYQKNVRAKEKKLEQLNKDLEYKVMIGIKEGQEKDRAMLHQSRLARLGTMLSMIAHQWRQPLTEVSGILMELETATKFKKVDDKLILECTKDSDRLLNYMSNTIDDFRNFFKPDKQKENFSVVDACEKSISIVHASLKDLDIELVKEFKDDTMVEGYSREFSQVLLNILLNCKDAYLERKIKNPRINLFIGKYEDNAIMTIQDNAGEIDKDKIDMIFEPYYTTKSSLKGTGLGLYMSKMIIEKNMNGKLNVKNYEDGVIFEIIL
jgi:signal transduction histidine kinase